MDDITFCMDRTCTRKTCMRNYRNIKEIWRPHSFAHYENTEYCPKVRAKERRTQSDRQN